MITSAKIIKRFYYTTDIDNENGDLIILKKH